MYTVRPLQRSTKNFFRIQVSATALLLLKLQSGDLCSIAGHDAIIWLAPEKIQDTVVQISRNLQDLYGIRIGDKVEITRIDSRTTEAITSVSLRLVNDEVSEAERLQWEWFLGHVVHIDHEYLVRGQTISVQLGGIAREFVVENPKTLSKVTPSTKFIIGTTSEKEVLTSPDPLLAAVGGLLDQTAQLQRRIDLIRTRHDTEGLSSTYSPSQGILLYGAKGTGKTLLINSVVASSKTWRAVHHVDALTAVKVDQEPALYIIDNLESIADRDTAASDKMKHIKRLFDDIQHHQSLVIAETYHPNNIHQSLRGPMYFRTEIEVPIPSRDDRLLILKALRGPTANIPDDSWLRQAAEKTHGYVGGDLLTLYCEATDSARSRTTQFSKQPNGTTTSTTITAPHLNGSSIPPPKPSSDDPSSPASVQYLAVDLSFALSTTGPSALNEIFLDRPNVHWTDIGGQAHLKRQLIQAVTWPLKHADKMALANVRPTKGILLYGPPGCSKTMLVQALATESGLNFLAVKGPELIKMYVGESERAVREVFRKARAARPSVIFFDEIDSLASSSGTSGDSTSGLNVMTTLLNEIDGFEELRGVLVVAATNKPYLLDPALMRPGRLGKKIYVGPPDETTRRAILTKWLKKSRIVDEGVWRGLDKLVRMTAGYSGAEIVDVCNTAGEAAVEDDVGRWEEDEHEHEHEDSGEPRTGREVGRAGGDDWAEAGPRPGPEKSLRIYLEALEEAIRKKPKGIKEKTLREFEEWRA